MSGQTVSVIIVSRHRPDDLRRCLLGLEQTDLPEFELVLVADPSGIAVAKAMGLSDTIKTATFDEANISAARNVGLGLAAGEVVAFIDDDAVAEPTWLGRLTQPFENPDVHAATGFVRGRNGISFQWKALSIGRDGLDRSLSVPDEGAILPPPKDGAIKTVGTNAAFRRRSLAEIGGFDPAFRFFLDETDVNLRLAKAGGLTAVVPLAQVHHGFAPSALRRADRVPTDLSQIAASVAVFHRKHGKDETAHRRLTFEAEQRRRLDAHLVRGALEPRDMRRLMQSASLGFDEGLERPITKLAPLPNPPQFLPWHRARCPDRHVALAGRPNDAKALMEDAAQLRSEGAVVTVFVFDRSARFHRMGLTDQGVWRQSGGLWGKSVRSDRLVRRWSFDDRVVRETARIESLRKPRFQQEMTEC